MAIAKVRKSRIFKGKLFSNSIKVRLFIADNHCYIPLHLNKLAGSVHLLKLHGILTKEMNQPQPLSNSVDFQGYLECQIPADALEVELKIKTKWGKFTLHTDQFTRMEKYRALRKGSKCKMHSRRRCLSDSHLNISSDSSMFINQGQGLEYPPKIFLDSNPDQEFPPHIPILQDYCRTCLTEKVRCSCQPMSNWSSELIDTTQLAPPNMDNNQDREDVQDSPLPSDWTDQDDFWLGKTYDKARTQSTLKPAPPYPLPMEMRTVSGVITFIHITTEPKPHHRSHPPNLLLDGQNVSELIPLPK